MITQNANFPTIVGLPQVDAMLQLLVRAPAGNVAEVGVYMGGSAWHMYPFCLAQERDLHLFDTFTGTPNSIEGLDPHKVNDEFRPPADTVAKISRFMPMAKLHIGEYPATHDDSIGPLAFIHCDCDQYESYVAVITKLWPLVVPGGIMLFDDYPYLAGAKKAVEEFFDISTLKVCHARNYVVKAGA